MFSAMVQGKITGVCGTKAMWLRREGMLQAKIDVAAKVSDGVGQWRGSFGG